MFFFFSSRRRHTRCALVTGVQTCALPIYIQLRNRWPIAEQLDAVADFGVGEYVHPVIRHAKATQDADRLGREAALWRVGLAFHEIGRASCRERVCQYG